MNCKMNYKINHAKQNGVALITAMIFLTILTLLGVTGMQSSTLQGKMAGNIQLSNQAFGYAEAGLAHAIRFYQDNGSVLNKTLSQENCHKLPDPPSPDNQYSTCTWFVAESKAQAHTSEQASSAKLGSSRFVDLFFAIKSEGKVIKSGNTLSSASLQRGVYRRSLSTN